MRLERVTLSEFEEVGIRGDRSITWRVELGESWCSAKSHPSAEVTPASAPPGTIWRTEIVLRLPRGARLLRIERRPRRDSIRDPLDYLTGREVRPDDVFRKLYRVVGGGRLVALLDDSRPPGSGAPGGR